jgi:hypothetical protein
MGATESAEQFYRRALQNMLPNALQNRLQNIFTEEALWNLLPVALQKDATNWLLQSTVLSSLILLGFDDLEGTNDQQVADGAQHKGLEDTWHWRICAQTTTKHVIHILLELLPTGSLILAVC